MQRLWNRAWIVGAAPLAVAAVVGGGIVFATDDDTTPSESAIHAQAAEDGPFSGFLAALAANLGISEDQLKESIKKTSLDQLDKAVADGTITQEVADKMRERIEAGEGFMFGMAGGKAIRVEGIGGPGGKHGGPGGMAIIGIDSGVAEFLGITEDQLREELSGGKALAQVAEAHGKSRDDLKAFLTAEHKAKLDEAVANGRLTQAQADEKAAEFATHVDQMIDAQLRIHIHEEGAEGMPSGGTMFRGRMGGMGERPAMSSSSSTLN